MSDETQTVEQSDLSWKLKAGILVMPYFFAWFTLRDGISKNVRIVSFVWMAIILASVSTQSSKEPLEESNKPVVVSAIIETEAPIVEVDQAPVKIVKEVVYEEPEQPRLTELEYSYNKIIVLKARLNNCRRRDHFSSNLNKFIRDFSMAKRLSESGRNPNGHLQVLNRNIEMVENQMSSFGC